MGVQSQGRHSARDSASIHDSNLAIAHGVWIWEA